MRISDLRCNHIEDPLGYSMDKTVLSWKVREAAGKWQSRARIVVGTDPALESVMFDSGDREDIDSLGFELPLTLEPETRYYWRVSVTDELGDTGTSGEAWFETGRRSAPWTGRFIGSETQTPLPLLRKSFRLDAVPERARLYIGAVGQFEVYINGARPEEEKLAPGCGDLDDWIPVNTYDVTPLLQSGENVIAVMQGEGWSKMHPLLLSPEDGHYGDNRCAVICELYGDGGLLAFSDTDWKTTPGFLLESSIYNGEVLDARRIPRGWEMPGFDDADWDSAAVMDYDCGKLTARYSLPVKVKETIKPVRLVITPAGEHVLDMGQNMVGHLQMQLDIPAGEELLLQFGEALVDGNFYNGNLMDAKQEFRYISDGKKRRVSQYFTYYGFQYVKVTGWRENMRPEDFLGLVLYSDVEVTGKIETGDRMINRLFQNAMWGHKGNFLGNPTDDTQRSERLGWTGDVQIFCGTAYFNMDCYAFYRKYLRDLHAEQRRFGGSVPYTVPAFRMRQNGSAAWGDVATILPWTSYLYTGDKTVLEESYPYMTAWTEFMGRGSENGLCTCELSFGDHMCVERTDSDYLANAYYLGSVRICARAAEVLGLTNEAKKWNELAEKVLSAIRSEFFTPWGRLAIDSQTASIYALRMGLVPEEHAVRTRNALSVQLERSKHHLTTGFLGTPFLCRTLSENGMNAMAYELLLNPEYPGWMYQVSKGATTMWECWDGIDENGRVNGSLNHYAYGSIVEWMYRCMAGINPVEDAPGFRKIRIAPMPDRRVPWAGASVDTAAGLVESGWEYAGGEFTFRFRIPFGCRAEITLPDADAAKVRINGVPSEGLGAVQTGSGVTFEADAGEYTAVYVPERSYENVCGSWMTIGELFGRTDTGAVMNRFFGKKAFGMPCTMGDILMQTPDAALTNVICDPQGPLFQPGELEALLDELARIPY